MLSYVCRHIKYLLNKVRVKSVPGSLLKCPHSISIPQQPREVKYDCYSHFTEEKTEACRGSVINTKNVIEVGLEASSLAPDGTLVSKAANL